MIYPKTKRQNHTENWYGQKIDDPYFWLESNNQKVKKWENKQNQLTRNYLDQFPYREKIKTELKKWFDIERKGTPIPKGEKIFQWRRKPNENHFVLYQGNKELLNPNKMNKNGNTAIDWSYFSNDGKYLAYGISDGGSELSTLKIINTDTKKELKDTIPYTRHSFVSWVSDNSGFYYTRYPQPKTVPKGEEFYGQKVFFHKLNTNWHHDSLIFSSSNIYKDYPSAEVSIDNKWLILTVCHYPISDEIYVSKISKNPEKVNFQPFIIGKNNHFSVTEFDDYFYVLTDYQSPNYRVLKISTKDVFTDESKWIDFVPENKNTLENFFIIGGKGVLKYQSKACSKLEIIDLNTQKRQEINLPTLGTVSNITGQTNKSIMYYSFESFSTPDTVFEFNTKTYTQKKLDSFNIGNTDISNIVTEQITYKSKDKTPVTMFIVKNKNLIKNGKNKTILYGYGGFNVSQNPVFSGHIIDWINSGGVFAIANLRGGSEYGEKWHQSGILQNKQNVFDDFIAAAEYLIHQKITQPKKLAIQGGSNGGLLVGVVMVQRPELFSAVICQVPLLDMIHYDQLKIAKSWRLEYGDPSDPQQFKFLYNYSPYHHVKNKTSYPAVFLTTAKNDIRVDAMHARKMTAKLQFSNASDKPILLYVDDQAGHGQGKPVSKILDDIADRYAFLDSILGN